MCVAIFKPAGVDLPSKETFRNCWDVNPHGAGMAYAAKGGIGVYKGFMKFEAFEAGLEKIGDPATLKKVDMFFHFRIATHGSVSPGNCHPFPIAGDAKTLKRGTGVFQSVLMHNGILPLTPKLKDTSDSMELARRLSAFSDDDMEKALELLDGFEGDNKIAVWRYDKGVRLFGDWKDRDGVYFSNLHHEAPVFGYGSWRSGAVDDYLEGACRVRASRGESKYINERKRCPYCDGELDMYEDGECYCPTCDLLWQVNKKKEKKLA